jgi:cytochrome b
MNLTESENSKKKATPGQRLLVWDLPTRLFHWLLVVLVIASFVTAKIGGIWMPYHVLSGCTILGLLLFRIIWGFMGGRYARFSAFIRSPSKVIKHTQTMLKKEAPKYPGHNPLGGWSVVAMLIALLVQVVTGLFANDDIFTEGPLYPWVSKATSDWLTHIHRLNQNVIIVLITIHVTAVLFYLIIKKENLILPMFSGHKYWDQEAQASTNQVGLALIVAGFLAVAIYLLLR